MLIVDICRQGSVLSYIVFEIVWLSILSVLWLLSGTFTVLVDGQIILSPDNLRDTQGSHEIKGIIAFLFLASILLMSYTAVLLVLAIRAKGQGNSAWTTDIRDGVLFYSARKTTGGAAQVQTVLAPIPYSLPPSQQASPQQFPPQQSYPSSYPIAQV